MVGEGVRSIAGEIILLCSCLPLPSDCHESIYIYRALNSHAFCFRLSHQAIVSSSQANGFNSHAFHSILFILLNAIRTLHSWVEPTLGPMFWYSGELILGCRKCKSSSASWNSAK